MKKTVFAGFGGQGVLMMGYVYAVAAMRDGHEVTYLPSYGAEVRGGTANCTVAVSDEEIFSPVASSPDFAVIMNNPSLSRFESAINEKGVVILNTSLVDGDITRTDIMSVKLPANKIAREEFGNERSVNMIMLGAFVTKTQVTSLESIMGALEEISKGKKAAMMKLNRKSLDIGSEYVLKGAR